MAPVYECCRMMYMMLELTVIVEQMKTKRKFTQEDAIYISSDEEDFPKKKRARHDKQYVF